MYPNIKKVYGELQQAWQAQGLPSTLLIRGKQGVGKKLLALQIAQFITCESRETGPCGKCFSCKNQNWQEGQSLAEWLPPLEGTSTELSKFETRRDRSQEIAQKILKSPTHLRPYDPQAKHRVEAARDLMKELRGGSDRPRAIIIPDADRMEQSVANALLKILEESPQKVWFILTTSHPERLLKTITSRSMQINLPTLTLNEYATSMVANKSFGTEELEWLYFFSEGAIGYGLHYDSGEVLACRQFALTFFDKALAADPGELLVWIDTDPQLSQYLNQGNLLVLYRMMSLIIEQALKKELDLPSLAFDLTCFESLDRERLFKMGLHLSEMNKMPSTVRPQVKLGKWGMECSLIKEGVL